MLKFISTQHNILTLTVHDNTTFWNADGSWTEGPKLPMPLMGHCVVQYDAVTTYLMGGCSNSSTTVYSSLYKYDWNASTWTQKSSMSTPRCGEPFSNW